MKKNLLIEALEYGIKMKEEENEKFLKWIDSPEAKLFFERWKETEEEARKRITNESP